MPKGKPGSSPVLTTYTTGDVGSASHYNITIEFVGSWSYSLQKAVTNSADRIAKIITGDIPECNGIDDIVVTANLASIDGRGGILADSDPNYQTLREYDDPQSLYHRYDELPSAGAMHFDSSDATRYLNNGLWDELVTHEMMHTIGFVGSIWKDKGLVDETGSYFIGDQALAQSGRSSIPLSPDGHHWSETVFGSELMTPAFNPFISYNPLSPMTAASLADLGYVVDLSRTNTFIDWYTA